MMINRPKSSAVLREENIQLGFNLWDGFSALMIMFFQVTWIIPMYRLVISWESMSSQIKLALSLSSIFIMAYLLSRGLQQLAVGKGAMRVAEILLLIGSVYGGMQILLIVPPNPNQVRVDPRTGNLVTGTRVPADMLIIFLAVVVMWRLGINFGLRGVRQREAERNFRFGLIVWLFFVFSSSLIKINIPMYFLFLSLFSGLVGLAFSRIGSVTRLRGGGKNQYSQTWTTEIIAGVGVVVAASAVLGTVIGGAAGKAFLGGALRLLALGLEWVSEPFFLLIENLSGKIRANLDMGEPAPEVVGAPGFEFPEKIVPENPFDFSFLDMQIIFPYLIGLIVLILILGGIWARRGVKAGEPIVYDDEWEGSSLFDGLRGSMAGLGENLAGNLRSWQDKYLRSMLAKARIRRMYARFLALCADLGIPRRESQTPLEFVPVAGQKFSGRGDDIEILTRAYVQVRYGEIPETDEEVEAILEAWKRIKKDGETLKKGSWVLKNWGDDGIK